MNQAIQSQQGQDKISQQMKRINELMDKPGIDDTSLYCLEVEKSSLDRRKIPRTRDGSLAFIR